MSQYHDLQTCTAARQATSSMTHSKTARWDRVNSFSLCQPTQSRFKQNEGLKNSRKVKYLSFNTISNYQNAYEVQFLDDGM